MNEELQKLKEEFEERIKELEDKCKTEEEWPKEGDLYWFLDPRGGICDKRWENDLLDGDLFEIGNVFKTREEALFEIERRKVLHKLRMMGRPFKSGEENWRFQLDGRNDLEVKYDLFYRVPYVDCYFDTKEEARQAIQKIGVNRTKKYLFGVEE